MPGNVKVVASTDDWNQILSGAGSKAIIVDFYADWCGPCKMISPLFEKLSEKPEYANIVFLNINVDNVEEVAATCKVSAMPTFQVWKGGAKVDELVGANPEKLEALVAKYA